MNKTELIDAVAQKAGLSKADTKKAIESYMAVTGDDLKKGDKIAIVGFGTFSVQKRAARNGHNPRTGKSIKIAAKKVVKFKAGANLAKKVK